MESDRFQRCPARAGRALVGCRSTTCPIDPRKTFDRGRRSTLGRPEEAHAAVVFEAREAGAGAEPQLLQTRGQHRRDAARRQAGDRRESPIFSACQAVRRAHPERARIVLTDRIDQRAGQTVGRPEGREAAVAQAVQAAEVAADPEAPFAVFEK
jgi:hypothetical protein